jgi:hypothetical protein
MQAQAQQQQQAHAPTKLAICEAAGDDWEDIEDLTPLAPGLVEPVCSDEDWLDALAADAPGAAGAADVGLLQHPWADDKCGSEPLVRATSIADANFAASLASCLSIFPLSSSALATVDGTHGATGGWELTMSAGDAGRLIDVSADHLDDAPIPRDWL